ncbi:MAG: NGG1p interacting factor NIF3, partial [Candidatus Omnitrophica bacterium]|nr:NGG1p interacting factor NIF3 [Candidatus Omnitrophota bacterium]
MKLKELYGSAIKLGIKHDPRGNKLVKEHLKKQQARYKSLKAEEKKNFDIETLTNPYNDTRILNGDPSLNVRTILCGIDIDVGEILLADTLKRQGEKIDLIMSHHPSGR